MTKFLKQQAINLRKLSFTQELLDDQPTSETKRETSVPKKLTETELYANKSNIHDLLINLCYFVPTIINSQKLPKISNPYTQIK